MPPDMAPGGEVAVDRYRRAIKNAGVIEPAACAIARVIDLAACSVCISSRNQQPQLARPMCRFASVMYEGISLGHPPPG